MSSAYLKYEIHIFKLNIYLFTEMGVLFKTIFKTHKMTFAVCKLVYICEQFDYYIRRLKFKFKWILIHKQTAGRITALKIKLLY